MSNRNPIVRCLIALIGIVLPSLSADAFAAVKIDHWQSPSGAKVLFVETHVLPIVDINVDFHAGAALDPPSREGLSDLTSNLLTLGAGSLDENQISERLADLGALMNASSSNDRLGISLRTLSDADKRDAAVALLAQIIDEPTFPPEVFARERDSAVAALKDSLTRPDTIANRAFWTAIYPGHPYGEQTMPESLERIKREDVVAFHRDHFTAESAVITLVGDLSRKEAEAIAERLVGQLPKKTTVSTKIPEVTLPQGGKQCIPHSATQAHILIGQPALKRGDPDFFALTVGNYVLGGGGFVSRLMKEVREKRGLAYSVYSYFMPMVAEGPFEIGLQTKRGQAEEALRVATQTLMQFLQQGPTEEELKAAKLNLIGGFPLRLDSNNKILSNVAVIGFYNLPLDWLDRYQEAIERVTIEDVRAAFARHLNKDNLVTVVLAGC